MSFWTVVSLSLLYLVLLALVTSESGEVKVLSLLVHTALFAAGIFAGMHMAKTRNK